MLLILHLVIQFEFLILSGTKMKSNEFITPTISIIIPVLNREATIAKAIQSVIDQHYSPIELIIIDGGSTDNTIAIIKEYESHIAYWHSKPDGSASVGSNLGVQKASGDLIVLLMADDWFEPNTFARIVEVYQSNPEAEIFTCGGRIIDYDEVQNKYRLRKDFNSQKKLALTLYNVCYVESGICCRFIKKSFYERNGIYHPLDAHGKHMFSNDKEFLLRAILNNVKNVHVDHLGYTYFAHPGSATFGNNRKNILRICEEHMMIADDYLKTKILTRKQKIFFHYWYLDQATRVCLYQILEGRGREAARTFVETFRRYHLIWPVGFGMITCQITAKKLVRGIFRFLRPALYA